MGAPAVIGTVDLPGIPLFRRGKVRDVFDLGDELLLVASDRISAFDVVLPRGIPDKGRVLTALSRFWFETLADVVPNHMITTDVACFPTALRPHADLLAGRSMLCRKTEPLPAECVVRGYLAGSGYSDYRKSGAICGHPLPPGLRQADRLPRPLFTPATKAEVGHDENISREALAALVGKKLAGDLETISLKLYNRASAHALERGIIIADTKFEFGLRAGELVLIDEALTPDSSRFWPARDYAPGSSPPSLDKQFVRDWLETTGWAKTPPAPVPPDEVVAGTSRRYREILDILTRP